jgi:mycothiol synthase
MLIEVRHASAADAAVFHALAAHPSLRDHFDSFQTEDGVRHDLTDPLVAAPLTHLALLDGRAAGFVAGYAVRPEGKPGWVYLRLGVIGAARRHGIARALLRQVARIARERDILGTGAELLLPMEDHSGSGQAFAARHGFRIDRYFWRMSRPAGPIAPPAWPPGVTVRTFDGSETALADWSAIYEESFAAHYRPVPSSPDLCRRIAASPDFLTDGLALAYREGRCVGFCRNETLGDLGIIGLLGVAPAARHAGLGRALLRWGVAYFADPRWKGVGLGVDGANDGATALYRSEGFAVDRRREIWAGSLDAVADGA